MGFLPDVPVLDGSLVRLEPLSPTHAADLAVAAEEDRAAYGFTVVPRAWEVEQYLAAHSERAKSGMLAPFAQIRQDDGRAIGVTAYWDPPVLAGPRRVASQAVRHRHRLDLAGRVGSADGHQRRGEAPAGWLCVRDPESGQGGLLHRCPQ